PSAPIIEDWVSDSEDESEGEPMPTQKAPSFVQSSEHVKTPRPSVKPVEHPTLAKTLQKYIPKSRGHRHSWNRKACFVCKSLTHLIKDCDYYEKTIVENPVRNHAMRGNHQHYARMTHHHPHRHVVPTSILTRSRLVPFTTARPVTTAVSQTKHALKDKGVIDSGCSRHMTGNISYLSNFKEINRGYVAFGKNLKGGKITGKGKIRTGKLDFDDVYFVKELKFNLFSVSQMCDQKNSVLFIDTECIILSFDFKLLDENHVLLRVLRENNIYNVDLKNIVPLGDLTCLFAKATLDESNLWHRRLGHINFKTMNKLVKGHLVRGLPSKVFENNHTCVACKKGKQHRASCKSKPVSYVSQPLQRLHMDLFGPTFVKSLNKKSYCLVVTDDYSRFSWVFFLATKDETSTILKIFIIGIENQITHKNGIAERKNRTLIEAARTMLADSLLPIPFWAEAVNTACYVQNRVLVTKPHNKTPYELLLDRTPSIGFMRLFGCPVTILNTLDPLGKFDRKADEGFLVGYSVNSKAFRVFNSRTRIVQETLHINFLENQPNVAGSGPTWLFDIDTLTQPMSYQPVVAGNQPNSSVGIQENFTVGFMRLFGCPVTILNTLDPLGKFDRKADEGFLVGYSVNRNQPNSSVGIQENFTVGIVEKEAKSIQQYVLLPLWSSGSKDPQNTDVAAFEVKKPESAVHVSLSGCDKATEHDDKTKREAKGKSPLEFTLVTTVGPNSTNSTNTFSAAGPSNNTVSLNFKLSGKSSFMDPSQYPDDPDMPALKDITYLDDEEDVCAEADFSNLETNITVSHIPIIRVHKDYPVTQIISDLSLAPQTRSMTRMVKEQGGLTQINDDNFHTCMFACFLSQEEPKRGHTQEEGIDYEEVFALVARIEAIWLFLAYASFMGFMVYQMDVKSAFLYETVKEEVYICQPLGFKDLDYPYKVYKVVKTLYGLHQAPRAWYETLVNYLLENGFQRGKIDQTLFIKKQKGGILLVQVYMDDIIFRSTNKDLCKAFEKLMKDKF
nr:hypothetical protein [Tanacetum cinerariifolium]